MLGRNFEDVNENSTPFRTLRRTTISDMLCETGQKLKDDFASASTRFSDSAPATGKRMPIAARLEIEKLQLAQQDALSAFRQHVEGCSVCSQRGN